MILMKSRRMQITGNMHLRLNWLLALLLATPVAAADFASIKAKRPELFHPKTGYRIDRQRSPTPHDIPAPAKGITAVEAAALLETGAIAIDVFGANQSRYDELDGTWLVKDPRQSLPNAVWLPEVGRGVLSDEMQAYFAQNLADLTEGDTSRALILFCVADCWMSWNAAQRATTLGYKDVNWFRLGTDGWLDEGFELAPVNPVPVNVD